MKGAHRRKLIAWIVVVTLVCTGTPPIVGSESTVPKGGSSGWSVELLDKNGEVVSLESVQPTMVDLSPEALAQLEQQIRGKRQLALQLRESSNPRIATRGERILKWIDIADAKTQRERHQLIRQLPVRIVLSDAGTVRSFVVDGKVRVRVSGDPGPAQPWKVIDQLQGRLSEPSSAIRESRNHVQHSRKWTICLL